MQLKVNKWLFSFALFVVWGCGPSEPKWPDLVPVSGAVTYEGKPLADALVIFSPMGSKQEGQGAAAFTDASGKYTLETAGGMEKPSQVPSPASTA